MTQTKTTVRIDDELLEEVQVACVRLKTTFTDAVMRGLRLWLDSQSGKPVTAKSGKTINQLSDQTVPEHTVNNAGVSTALNSDELQRLERILEEMQRIRTAVDELRRDATRSRPLVQDKRSA